MSEYTVTISFVVDAHDRDEAVEIANHVRENLKTDTWYKLRDVETHTIEVL